MKLIIDIPEVDYNYAKQQVADGITNPLKIFIASGIPLEQIRDEIKHLLNRPSLTHVIGYDKGFVDGIDKVLQIIDNYKGE